VRSRENCHRNELSAMSTSQDFYENRVDTDFNKKTTFLCAIFLQNGCRTFCSVSCELFYWLPSHARSQIISCDISDDLAPFRKWYNDILTANCFTSPKQVLKRHRLLHDLVP